MVWVSFDPLRTLGFANTRFIKPDQLYLQRELLSQADLVLFPEYWQLGALVYGMKRRVFPSLPTYQIGHDKVEMTRALTALVPANVPDTVIAANTPEKSAELWERMVTPFVAKIPRSARGTGVWLIENRADWRAYLAATDVLYLQEYLPIDRDLRIVLVGERVVATYWRLQSANGFHNNISRGGVIEYGAIPDVAVQLVLEVARHFGIDHAGFDVAMVGGRPYLLEFNRLFGNAGIPGGDQAVREAILGYLGRNQTLVTPVPLPVPDLALPPA